MKVHEFLRMERNQVFLSSGDLHTVRICLHPLRLRNLHALTARTQFIYLLSSTCGSVILLVRAKYSPHLDITVPI